VRKKFDTETIECEIVHFITVTKGSEECGDYLISQLIAIVGDLTKKKQTEFLNGLINAKQELVWKICSGI
jgi:hypothetical protein